MPERTALEELDNIRWDDIGAIVEAADPDLWHWTRKYLGYVRDALAAAPSPALTRSHEELRNRIGLRILDLESEGILTIKDGNSPMDVADLLLSAGDKAAPTARVGSIEERPQAMDSYLAGDKAEAPRIPPITSASEDPIP